MRSGEDYRSKLIIIWHRVKTKLYMGYIFIARTFDFGQIHVKEELKFILMLVCLGCGQPDYLNWKHVFAFRILPLRHEASISNTVGLYGQALTYLKTSDHH